MELYLRRISLQKEVRNQEVFNKSGEVHGSRGMVLLPFSGQDLTDNSSMGSVCP